MDSKYLSNTKEAIAAWVWLGPRHMLWFFWRESPRVGVWLSFTFGLVLGGLKEEKDVVVMCERRINKKF